jgi:hypothetical protein
MLREKQERAIAPMYTIHLVESRENDQPVLTKIFQGSSVADATVRAKVLIDNIELAKPSAPWHSDVIGFIICDASGREVCRRYLENK